MKIITAFLLGLFFLNSTGEVKALTAPCQNLWWFDNTNLVCSQKNFCGSYMYQDLRTFTTKEECMKNLPISNCSMKRCGDANCDGKIDVQDLLIWMRKRNSTNRTADFNDDGKTNSVDYEIIKSGMKNGCPTPTVVIPKVTQVPTITCEILQKINSSRSENYFKMCADNEYPKVCFNKYSGIYQGCGTLERDDCTEFNMNADKNIRCDSNYGGGLTPTVLPTATPIVLKNVEWTTQWASFVASNFQIKVADGTSQGKTFTVNPTRPCNSLSGERVCVHSNPPYLMDNGLYYMTLEVVWFENDIEMRMFVYLYSDGKRWWSNEIRVYNGQAQPNTEWVYFYGKFFDALVGQSFRQSGQFLLNAADPKNGNSPVTLSFSNVKFGAFKNYFNQATPTPRIPTPSICGTLSYVNYVETCYDSSGSEKRYRYVDFRCGNGLIQRQGSPSSCKTAADWKSYAAYICDKSCANPTPHVQTPTPVRMCDTDNDCLMGQKCYQPPMPVCKEGMVCSQVMPAKYCVGSAISSVPITSGPRPTVVGCNKNGDADGDGATTLKDYAIWKYEYSNNQVKRADFDCNKRVDMEDYQIWKKAFLLAKSLVVSTNN